MPWLHKSKKSSKAGSFGDCPAAGKSGKVPQAASPQQQLHQPAASHDELQAALHSVLEALRNLTEKQRQGPPASPPQHQPEAPQRHHRSSQEKKLADKKQQQQQQQQQQPEPPPISGETFRNLQNYFSRISSRGRSSTEAAVAVSIEESGTTFGTDQLDPPSSASRLRRRNFRPTRRQLLPPEADIVSGLTSEDLQASDASGDGDKDETAADDATERHDGSPTRRCFRGELVEADVTPERARSIRSPQPPTLTALGCSVVTHCGCPSQQAAAILLIRQEPSVCRPPARAPNQQLPQCDEQHRCSTKSLLIRDAVPEALKPPTEPSVAEAAEKSADCGVAPCSTALNTCADGDSISKTGTSCSTEAAGEDGEADSSGSEGEEGGIETETDAGSAVNGNTGAWTGCREAGNTVGANGNTGAWTGCREAVGANGNTGAWMGCREAGSAVGANGNNGARMGCRAGGPQNPLQVHSVIESKLLESACESFPPTEAELAAPSSSNAVDSELPRFGKVELPPEPPRTAELGCNSSGSASSATTLEVLDNGNDDCDTEAGEGGSCCTFDPVKSSGFAQLLLTLDRAQRRLEGLAPSAVPPPSGDSAEPPLAPAAQQQQQQQRLYKQRASVQTLNQMLQRSPFVCRGRDRSPSTDETQHHHHQQQQHQQQQQQQHQQQQHQQQHQQHQQQQHQQQQHQQQHQQHQQQQQQQQHHQQQQQPWQPVQRQSPTAWQQSSWTLHQQLACQPQLSDLNQSNPQSDKLIVTTAASLMTLTQSLQRCVLQIEAAVSRLNGNSIS
ncbi:hypothetical protein BOX15_Mlig017659g2 [Macrostomum lignano]|uniref:Uncharacterized protein n=1 Tax=Macrostomum lignano TaxID=282301 RepID=A0A267EH68_9PLAT|nr:hypothetical protein BOX15_Mlig017659g2 [Macrostomum lignano]